MWGGSAVSLAYPCQAAFANDLIVRADLKVRSVILGSAIVSGPTRCLPAGQRPSRPTPPSTPVPGGQAREGRAAAGALGRRGRAARCTRHLIRVTRVTRHAALVALSVCSVLFCSVCAGSGRAGREGLGVQRAAVPHRQDARAGMPVSGVRVAACGGRGAGGGRGGACGEESWDGPNK